MYQAINADPPWSYNDRTPRGGAENHYRTMSLSDLAGLRAMIDQMAAPDCALFMWATWPMITEALYLINAWGFAYKTCAFAWVKTTGRGTDAMGLGHYTRGNTEPCLLATRGKPKRVDASVRQVILDDTFTEETLFAPRGRHSAKPGAARDRIVRLMGDVPRIELFARERADGWVSWGDQISDCIAP